MAAAEDDQLIQITNEDLYGNLPSNNIEEFRKYKDQLDDKFINAEIDFFDLTYNRGQKRFNESKLIYKEILSNPFDYHGH